MPLSSLRILSRFYASVLAVALSCAWGSVAASAETVSVPPVPAQIHADARAASLTPQERFVQGLGDRAIAILANRSISETERDNQFRQMLKDSFDLATIGRFVIGRSWNAATPEQQAEYLRLFEELVVKTYSDRFALYTGEGFVVRSVRQEGERDFVVNSDISHPDGSMPTTVEWRLRQKADKVGIIDVVVEGISMSVTQRQEYSAVIQRNGGNIDGLLELMRGRLDQQRARDLANKG